MGTIFPNSQMREQRLRDGQASKVTQPDVAERYLDTGLPASSTQTLGCLSFEGTLCGPDLADLHLLT